MFMVLSKLPGFPFLGSNIMYGISKDKSIQSLLLIYLLVLLYLNDKWSERISKTALLLIITNILIYIILYSDIRLLFLFFCILYVLYINIKYNEKIAYGI